MRYTSTRGEAGRDLHAGISLPPEANSVASALQTVANCTIEISWSGHRQSPNSEALYDRGAVIGVPLVGIVNFDQHDAGGAGFAAGDEAVDAGL